MGRLGGSLRAPPHGFGVLTMLREGTEWQLLCLPLELMEWGSSHQLKASCPQLAPATSVRMRWELVGASPWNTACACTSTEPFLGVRRRSQGLDLHSPSIGSHPTNPNQPYSLKPKDICLEEGIIGGQHLVQLE